MHDALEPFDGFTFHREVRGELGDAELQRVVRFTDTLTASGTRPR